MLRTLPARLLLSSALTLVLVALATAPAQAAIIDLDLSHERTPFTTNTEGDARGIYFEATSSFSITSVGIFARLQNKPASSEVKTFDVLVYSVTSGAADQVLASAINQTPEFDAGETADRWNDIAINYSFQEDNEYIVLWRPNDGLANGWVNELNSPLKIFGFTSGDASDVSVLPLLTVLRGRSGSEAQFITNAVPHFRFNAIPEPASLAMLGLAGTAVLLRRRR